MPLLHADIATATQPQSIGLPTPLTALYEGPIDDMQLNCHLTAPSLGTFSGRWRAKFRVSLTSQI